MFKIWNEAVRLSDIGPMENWVCVCHLGHVFSGPTKQDAENARAKYYGETLPHPAIYNQGR